MHSTSLKQEIARLHSYKELPEDNGEIEKDYMWFRDLKVNQHDEELEDLINNLYESSLGSLSRKSDMERHRRHCELVLLNLSRAALSHRWGLISRTSNDYSEDFYYKRMGLSHRTLIRILDHLVDSEIITEKRGKVYSKQPLMTRIYPLPELATKLHRIALNTEEEIKPPYVGITEGQGGYEKIINRLNAKYPDELKMTRINEYLQYETWAYKGPVILKYKNTPFQGGRLYTPFQCLPSRKYKIRPNTLINGKAICEVDFNVNHLRMNLAVLSGEDAGDTPYEDIMQQAGLDSRDKVKSFITIAMGASERDKAMSAGHEFGISNELFERIESATYKRYPKLLLYEGFGIKAQSLEGQILIGVMLEGVKQDIVTLPVHDALAVNVEYAQWCKEQMIEKWIKHCCSSAIPAAPRVKFNL